MVVACGAVTGGRAATGPYSPSVCQSPPGLACFGGPPRRYRPAMSRHAYLRARSRASHPLVLAALVFHPVPWVASAAAGNARTPVGVLEFAAGVGALRGGGAAAVAGLERLSSPRMQRRLARRYGHLSAVQNHLARDPDLSTDLCRDLLGRGRVTEYALAVIARRRGLPEDVYGLLAERAESRGPSLGWASLLVELAMNPSCPSSVLSRWACTSDIAAVLKAVTENPNTPEGDVIVAGLRIGEVQGRR